MRFVEETNSAMTGPAQTLRRATGLAHDSVTLAAIRSQLAREMYLESRNLDDTEMQNVAGGRQHNPMHNLHCGHDQFSYY